MMEGTNHWRHLCIKWNHRDFGVVHGKKKKKEDRGLIGTADKEH